MILYMSRPSLYCMASLIESHPSSDRTSDIRSNLWRPEITLAAKLRIRSRRRFCNSPIGKITVIQYITWDMANASTTFVMTSFGKRWRLCASPTRIPAVLCTTASTCGIHERCSSNVTPRFFTAGTATRSLRRLLSGSEKAGVAVDAVEFPTR